MLAVTYPWAPASSYLSSQSVADSRCNPHATPRSSYSRRSPSRRFFLCRSALLCLVLQRHCCLSVPCSRGFSCLSAQIRSPRCVLWPLKFIQLTSRENDSSDAHSDHLPPRQVVTQVHSFFDHLCLYRRRREDGVKKERKQTTQGRDGRTVHRHHTGIFKERSVVSVKGVGREFFSLAML